MGVFKSIYRYVVTLGGLIGSDIDSRTNAMLATPGGIKASYAKTREGWKNQYQEVRSAVAQILKVLEDKRRLQEQLRKEAVDTKTKMKGAVEQYKRTNEERYKLAFSELFSKDKEYDQRQAELDAEIKEMHAKVEAYKIKLKEMDSRIQELDEQEAIAIADIVSSQQIINLNDRLSNLSTELDDENLKAIEDRRRQLLAEAKLSGELGAIDSGDNLDKELMKAGRTTDADDLFASMVAESAQKQQTSDTPVTDSRKREL